MQSSAACKMQHPVPGLSQQRKKIRHVVHLQAAAHACYISLECVRHSFPVYASFAEGLSARTDSSMASNIGQAHTGRLGKYLPWITSFMTQSILPHVFDHGRF